MNQRTWRLESYPVFLYNQVAYTCTTLSLHLLDSERLREQVRWSRCRGLGARGASWRECSSQVKSFEATGLLADPLASSLALTIDPLRRSPPPSSVCQDDVGGSQCKGEREGSLHSLFFFPSLILFNLHDARDARRVFFSSRDSHGLSWTLMRLGCLS